MKKRFLSVIVVLAMLIQMCCINMTMAATETEQDLFELLKNNAIYAIAGKSGNTENGLLIRDGRNMYGNAVPYQLYDIAGLEYDSATDSLVETQMLTDLVAAMRATGTATSEASIRKVLLNAKRAGGQYATDWFDGAWRYANATDGTVQKDVWFTAPYYRYRAAVADTNTQFISPTGPYFCVDNDLIDATDNKITFVFEYFDAGTGNINIMYANSAGARSTVTGAVRTNTNTWKTAVVSVSDAAIAKVNSSNTGLVSGKDDFRFEPGTTPLYLSRVMVVKTSDYNILVNGGTVTPTDPSKESNTDSTDWFGIASQKGAYIDAANGDTGTAIKAFGASTPLLDLSVAADKATAESNAALKSNIASLNLGYATLAGGDFAWMFKTASDLNSTSKKAFFTTNHVTPRTDWCKNPGGAIYFETTDRFTSSDNSVYFVMEYLDKGTTSIGIEYIRTDGKSTVISIPRKDTGYWKTAVVSVNNANMNASLSGGILQGVCNFRINASRSDLFVSRMAVVKASDVNATVTGAYTAPEVSGSAPTIWLAGDSIVENLDLSYFPREGWGMEIANYFIQKSQQPGASVDTTTGNATGINDGVVVVNKARGGKSSRTFLNQHDPTMNGVADPADPNAYFDTRWTDIKLGAKKGDYLFVNFGHNDANNGRWSVKTTPYITGDFGDGSSFRANLVRFIETANALGVNLVFITSSHNYSFYSDGTVAGDGVEAHRDVMKQVGAQFGIPVIDLDAYHRQLLLELGHTYAPRIYAYNISATEYPSCIYTGQADKTHITQTGARELCKFIVKDIKAKAQQNIPSMVELAKWINPEADLTTMTKPQLQTSSVSYDVSDIKYTVDGAASSVVTKGEVVTSVKVKNNGTAANSAVLYTAVYDMQGKLTDIATSGTKDVAAGASVTLTTDAITVPEFDGYTFRKFIWGKGFKPYNYAEGFSITADGFNRRAVVKWNTTEDADGYTYDVYRDNEYIATVDGGAYIDEGVTRGEHTYQVNVMKDSDIVYQTGYAVATVTSIDDVTSSGILYAKANIDSMGNEADITKNIKQARTAKLYAPSEMKKHFSYITDEQVAHATQKGRWMTNSSDGPVSVVRVKDSDGVEREAWFTSAVTRSSTSSEISDRDAYMYFQILNNTITSSDRQVCVYVEYLSNQSSITLQYVNGATSTSTQSFVNKTPGKWSTARFILNDAYFNQTGSGSSTTDFGYNDGKSDLRISSNGKPIYVSSIVVTKGGTDVSNSAISLLNNKEFYQANLMEKSDKYPDGVSIDFSSGKATSKGLTSYIVSTGNPDAKSAIEQDLDGKYYVTTKYTTTTGAEGGPTKQTYLYFDVDDSYMFGLADNTFVMELEYKVNYDGDINMMVPIYDSTSGKAVGSTGKNLFRATASSAWQKKTVVVDGAALLGTDNAGCDFRLYTPATGAEDCQLMIRSIKVKNATHLNPQITQTDNTVTLHIAADSIAANYAESATAANRIYGWGMSIGDLLSGVKINNKATPGTSTLTFGNMGSILGSVKEGDYVLISFGHNDQMSGTERYTTVEQYKANLKNWIGQIREKHGVPVLVTMIPQLNRSTGVLKESASFDERRAAVAEVANSEDVMLVELGEQMFADEDNGKFTSSQYINMYCDEDAGTHLAKDGADYVAKIIVDSLKTQSNRFATFVK